jgi:SAM-dependent methyltransferase
VHFTCGLAPAAFGPEERDADVMLEMDVMEHVPDDFLLASSLLAALKPGGHLLITVPADAALWSAHDEAFGHCRRYDRQRLERVWRDLPVTPLLMSHAMARLYPLVRAVRGWNRLRGRAAGQAGPRTCPPMWCRPRADVTSGPGTPWASTKQGGSKSAAVPRFPSLGRIYVRIVSCPCRSGD